MSYGGHQVHICRVYPIPALLESKGPIQTEFVVLLCSWSFGSFFFFFAFLIGGTSTSVSALASTDSTDPRTFRFLLLFFSLGTKSVAMEKKMLPTSRKAHG